MRKIQLLMLFVLSAIIFQGCKKDVVTSASTTSDQILAATINGTSWIPDDVTANITYTAGATADANTKTFTVQGTADSKRVRWVITLSGATATNANAFPLATYKVDKTTRVQMGYYEISGDSGYQPVGTVGDGAGSIIITAIDPTKNVITGTYYFSSRKVNLNPDGSVASVQTQQILGGSFTNLPYTFTSN